MNWTSGDHGLLTPSNAPLLKPMGGFMDIHCSVVILEVYIYVDISYPIFYNKFYEQKDLQSRKLRRNI